MMEKWFIELVRDIFTWNKFFDFSHSHNHKYFVCTISLRFRFRYISQIQIWTPAIIKSPMSYANSFHPGI